MLSLSDIKTGKHITLHDEPYVVMSHEHSKTGRAGAVLRTKLKNLRSGAIIEKTFQGSDKVDDADISKSEAQYLYRDGSNFVFMDNTTFDQFFLSSDVIGSNSQYLVEGTTVTVLNFEGVPVNIDLPIKMTLRVTEAPPGIKGDSVSSATKVVTLETGATVSTPLFVNEGDSIIVNTETGQYVSRA